MDDVGVVILGEFGDIYVVVIYDKVVVLIVVIWLLMFCFGSVYFCVGVEMKVDELIINKFCKLGVMFFEVVDDVIFLWCVYLDIIGILLLFDKVCEFFLDYCFDKWKWVIDELFEILVYVVWWIIKLCDIIGNNL